MFIGNWMETCFLYDYSGSCTEWDQRLLGPPVCCCRLLDGRNKTVSLPPISLHMEWQWRGFGKFKSEVGSNCLREGLDFWAPKTPRNIMTILCGWLEKDPGSWLEVNLNAITAIKVRLRQIIRTFKNHLPKTRYIHQRPNEDAKCSYVVDSD